MGLIYRKRKRVGGSTWLNFSKRGIGASERIGPVTLNSRGSGRIRIAPGLSYRFSAKKRVKPKATFYQHPGCSVHHKTLQAAQRCAVKTSRVVVAPVPRPVQPLSPPAGWYPCSTDPAGSVRYWDGRRGRQASSRRRRIG